MTETTTTKKPSAARSTLGIFLTRLLTIPLTIVSSAVVARIIGPNGRGVYSFLLLLGSFILPILLFGFGAAITYFLASRRYLARQILCTCLAVGLMMGSSTALLIGLLWYVELLGETAKSIPPSLMLPMLALLPIQAAVLLLTRVVLGESLFWLNNWITLSMPVIASVFSLLLVAGIGAGVEGALIAVMLANIAALTGLLVFSVKQFRPVLRIDFGFIRAGFDYGIKSWLGDLAVRMNLRLDQFLLGLYVRPELLGIYGVAVTISELLWMIPDSLSFVLFNKIAAQDSVQSRAELMCRVHRVLLVVMVSCAVGMAIVAKPAVVWLFGKEYESSVQPLLILLPGTVAMTTVKSITKFFGGSGNPWFSSLTVCSGAVLSAVTGIILIPAFHVLGAAAASTTGYLANAITAIVLFRYYIKADKACLFHGSRDDLRWMLDQCRMLMPKR